MKMIIAKSRIASLWLKQLSNLKLGSALLAIGLLPFSLEVDLLSTSKVELLKYNHPRQIVRSSYNFSSTPSWYRSTVLSLAHKLSPDDFKQALLNALPGSIRSKARPFLGDILKLSEHYQVDPLLVTAVVWTESHFKKSARSHKNARGLMQVVPTTGVYLHKKIYGHYPYTSSTEALNNPSINIELGVFYLKRLIKQFKSTKMAIVAYNMGPSRVRSRLRRKMPVGQSNLYLNKVRAAYLKLQKSYHIGISLNGQRVVSK